MKIKFVRYITQFILLIFLSCSKNPTRLEDLSTVIDVDGNVYGIIKIGKQLWMAENLKVTRYRNGDTIPHVVSAYEWHGLRNGAYCIFNNDSLNFSKLGCLYNWDAVNDIRKISPKGWRVPTDDDWKELEIQLGMEPDSADIHGFRGTDEGGKLKEVGTIHWLFPNQGATNSSGFNAISCGFRSSGGNFWALGYRTYFWTETEDDSSHAWGRGLYHDRADIIRGNFAKANAFSIRCLKN